MWSSTPQAVDMHRAAFPGRTRGRGAHATCRPDMPTEVAVAAGGLASPVLARVSREVRQSVEHGLTGVTTSAAAVRARKKNATKLHPEMHGKTWLRIKTLVSGLPTEALPL